MTYKMSCPIQLFAWISLLSCLLPMGLQAFQPPPTCLGRFIQSSSLTPWGTNLRKKPRGVKENLSAVASRKLSGSLQRWTKSSLGLRCACKSMELNDVQPSDDMELAELITNTKGFGRPNLQDRQPPLAGSVCSSVSGSKFREISLSNVKTRHEGREVRVERFKGTLRQEAYSHPGTRDTMAKQARWFRDKLEEVNLLRNHPGIRFRPGQIVYGQREDGILVQGTLMSVRRCKNRLLYGKVKVTGAASNDAAAEGKVELFRIPCIFPVGGCNGGLETELHKMLQGRRENANNDEDEVLEWVQYGERQDGSALKMFTLGLEPMIETILLRLEQKRKLLMQLPFQAHSIEFTKDELMELRQGFHRTMVRGETRLMRFCEVLARTIFVGSSFSRSSVVTGETKRALRKERFTIMEPLSDELLWSLMPGQELGSTLLSSMQVLPMQSLDRALHHHAALLERVGIKQKEFVRSDDWQKPKLISHSVMYEALSSQDVDRSGGVLRFSGYKKSDDEVFDMVADKLCNLDAFIGSSTTRGRYSDSQYIRNILSVRIVVESANQGRKLLARLRAARFAPSDLHDADVPFLGREHAECTDRLEVLEVQDHLDYAMESVRKAPLERDEERANGWRGLVVMVRWWGVPVMIVIKPLEVFHLEQELSTAESRVMYKERQNKARHAVAKRWPIFALLRSLVHWMFVDSYGDADLEAPKVANTPRITLKIIE
uniref:Uncharacterized protein n=1 Tax=Hanusia phi TaxID=3032 RepID=A0A7S0ENS0_9CRYP|mmetsp:Transcript_27512/g.62414  ORF Transcript_27512/g.62414 Transcript_27512/m.62414 type:complete len:717 (+) Transcript_27512:329-2479(+)